MDRRLVISRSPVLEDSPAPFIVELSEYSGPLDLLLTLIRDEKIDIYDIPIARIAEQFLQRIRTLGLDQAADYLEMAARLLRIKAQLLLPRSGTDDEWEDPRAELVRRLLEYQQIREIVDHMERLSDDRRRRFSRAYLPELPAPPLAPLALSLVELLAAVDRVLRVTQLPDLHDVIPRPLDVDGAMQTVRGVLSLRERVRWRDVVPPDPERWQILSVLLALLEMARRGELSLEQLTPFSNVWINRDPAGQAA
jgi:segregation and condensation protein A